MFYIEFQASCHNGRCAKDPNEGKREAEVNLENKDIYIQKLKSKEKFWNM